jgi:hypothetical protein
LIKNIFVGKKDSSLAKTIKYEIEKLEEFAYQGLL